MAPTPKSSGWLSSDSARAVRALSFAPYIFNVHGKFYAFTEQGTEESIDYPGALKALVACGYQGSIDSEYEGQRLTQDAFPTDSCAQVRRQHAAMRSVLYC